MESGKDGQKGPELQKMVRRLRGTKEVMIRDLA